MQLKIYRYLIGAYGVILLVSLALFYLLPKDDLLDPAFFTAGVEKDEFLLDARWAGELEGVEGVYRYNQLDLDYEGDTLKILSGGSGEGEAPITIKRTAEGSGKIAAVEYRQEGFPCDDQLIPYRIDLKGNRLTVHDPGRYEFKFRLFNREVPVDQFKEKGEFQFHDRVFLSFNLFQELYLYIPAGLELEYDPGAMFLIFADEE